MTALEAVQAELDKFLAWEKSQKDNPSEIGKAQRQGHRSGLELAIEVIKKLEAK